MRAATWSAPRPGRPGTATRWCRSRMPAAEAALDRRARGFAVEAAAREYLLAAGLRPLAGNVAFRGGELDLVMQDRDALGELLVFVEVRFRADAAFGGGA